MRSERRVQSDNVFLRHIRRRLPVSAFGAAIFVLWILAFTVARGWFDRHLPGSGNFAIVVWSVILLGCVVVVAVAVSSRRARRR